jgi:hypothetical protein
MSLPTFPFKPGELTRDNAINLILTSIAMEEVGLSHIINAEGEKLQYMLGTLSGMTGSAATVDQVLQANESIHKILQTASYNQLFLSSKMENALAASEKSGENDRIAAPAPGGTLVFGNSTQEFVLYSRTNSDENLNLILGANGVVAVDEGMIDESLTTPVSMGIVYPASIVGDATITAWTACINASISRGDLTTPVSITAQLFYAPPQTDTPFTQIADQWQFVDAVDLGIISVNVENEYYNRNVKLDKPFPVAAGGFLLIRYGIAATTVASVEVRYVTASVLLG